MPVYYGDLHVHSVASSDVDPDEGRTQAEIYAEAISNGLAFVAVTDHSTIEGGGDVYTEQDWESNLQAVKDGRVPGAFEPILAMEWSPEENPNLYGHANIYWEMPHLADMIDCVHYPTPPDLLRATVGESVIVSPHHIGGGKPVTGNRCWNWAYYSRQVMPIVEAYSGWGSYMQYDPDLPDSPESCWPGGEIFSVDGPYYVYDAWIGFNRRLGIYYSSDAHAGIAGAYGMVAVQVSELTVAAIFEALRARRCYGTITPMRMQFCINNMPMGSECVLPAGSAMQIAGYGDARAGQIIDSMAVYKYSNGVWSTAYSASPSTRVHQFVTTEVLAASTMYYMEMIRADPDAHGRQASARSSPIWCIVR